MTYLDVACEIHLHFIRKLECSDVIKSNNRCSRASCFESSLPVANQLLFPKKQKIVGEKKFQFEVLKTKETYFGHPSASVSCNFVVCGESYSSSS